MKKFILPAFILMVLVQWIIPSQMIWSRERILSNGKEFRFMTRPVDPVSPSLFTRPVLMAILLRDSV